MDASERLVRVSGVVIWGGKDGGEGGVMLDPGADKTLETLALSA